MRAKEFIYERSLKQRVADEDYDPNGPPPGPEFKPTMPKGTVKVDVSDVYDWYKLGQHISNLKGLGKHDFGSGPPSTIMAFGDEDTEHKYINDLEKTGLTTTDIDPVDPHQPKGMKRQKVDPTYNVGEGVAEGSENNATAQKIFFARSKIAPKGWSYDHVGFITQDGKQIQMSGHKGDEVYVTNDVTDDPEFPKQKIKIVSLSKSVSVPTTNSVGAENCGTFVANVLQANGIKGIDTQKLYSVMKKPLKQGVAEGTEQEGLVSQFLKSISPKELRYYSIRDNCGPAALHMRDWAKKQGIDLKRHDGYFVADKVVYDKLDFTKEMKRDFLKQGLDFNDPAARKEFIESNPEYSEEWKKVPHYWLQDNQGNIYDPTGYIQFIKTGLSSDLDSRRYLSVKGVAEGQLDSLVNADQAERNAYKKFVDDQTGGDWALGAKLYAELKKRSADDIFGDDARLNRFMRTKFVFGKFTDKDWKNYWLLSQHADRYPSFQQQALNNIEKYLGQDNDYYRYLADRISCAASGQQKYGTQSICGKQGVAEDTVDEMALAKYQTFGDFTKPGPFRGADKKLVPHPKNIEKATRFFEQTPYDFRLFFSNVPGTGKYSEYGPMTPQQITDIFGEQAPEIIDGSEDAITVVYVGNKGDSKVMLTPWMMAHRFGHAIQAGARNKNWHAWAEAEKYFFQTVNSVLEEHYGKVPQTRPPGRNILYQLEPEYNALFNALGTQRSSRSNQIKRPYEFLYEIFAQYLGTGKVTFNPLPTNLGYGRQVWGTPTKYLNIKPEYRDEGERKQEAERLAYTMELLFNDVLSDSVGKIFVM